MLHNMTGYILTADAVRDAEAALTTLRASKASKSTLLMRGVLPPSNKPVTFEATLNRHGLLTA